MKKLSLALAALLVAGGLAACDGKKNDTVKTPGFGRDVPAEAQTPPPAVAPAAPASAPEEAKK